MGEDLPPIRGGRALIHRWLARPCASFSGGGHRSMRGGTRRTWRTQSGSMNDEGAQTVTSVAEQRLALALEAAELGTWTWDMASATTTWDARLEALHGLPPGGFGGTFDDWVAALHPDDRAECIRRVERALANPSAYVLLHRCTWPDGSIHWIECRGRVTVDADGAATGTIGVAIDVTARERRAAAVARALEKEHYLVEALQRAILPTTLPS